MASNSPEMFDDPSRDASRIEVYRKEQSLNLRKCDNTVERLARVFKASIRESHTTHYCLKNVIDSLGKFCMSCQCSDSPLGCVTPHYHRLD